MAVKTYIAQGTILHGRTSVPKDGELQLSDEQAQALGDAVKLKPDATSVEPEPLAPGQQ